eukprot:Protomagalhaensia_sp_Gyna_25__3081@NODE_282_length_4052_cov_158_766758_g217_i0_p1_GENE_NODE_282_length_4052_cov_158_766758_g217_i0NODE_282_length_4052_cov_158_766758_g217_i0_p1_ORF_typecomplete_len411_score44_71_NODE_282_length_4052_cov_158_766758_g217_i010392271
MKNAKPLCFGAVLWQEPHVNIRTRLMAQLEERAPTVHSARSRRHSSVASGRSQSQTGSHPDRFETGNTLSSVSETPMPTALQGRPSRCLVKKEAAPLPTRWERIRSLLQFSDAAEVTMERANFGMSDRYATLWGCIPLAAACHAMGATLIGWGMYDAVSGWAPSGQWDWEGFGYFTYGVFRITFGLFMVLGVLLKNVLLLYITAVIFQVFVLSSAVSYVTSWITWLMAFTGLNQDPWRPTWDTGYRRIVYATVVEFLCSICLGCAWFYGAFKSTRSIIVAGGTGFEKLAWFEVMAQKEEIMSWLGSLVQSAPIDARFLPTTTMARLRGVISGMNSQGINRQQPSQETAQNPPNLTKSPRMSSSRMVAESENVVEKPPELLASLDWPLTHSPSETETEAHCALDVALVPNV